MISAVLGSSAAVCSSLSLIHILAAAAGYNDEADAQYLGVAERNLTIRAEESKSAQKLQQLEEGETVYITELGKEWLAVVKQGVKLSLIHI